MIKQRSFFLKTLKDLQKNTVEWPKRPPNYPNLDTFNHKTILFRLIIFFRKSYFWPECPAILSPTLPTICHPEFKNVYNDLWNLQAISFSHHYYVWLLIFEFHAWIGCDAICKCYCNRFANIYMVENIPLKNSLEQIPRGIINHKIKVKYGIYIFCFSNMIILVRQVKQ